MPIQYALDAPDQGDGLPDEAGQAGVSTGALFQPLRPQGGLSPLFKWPGGKTGELSLIRARTPLFPGRYIEPFLGGGALWLDLAPRASFVGDLSGDIMSFFKGLKSPDLRAPLIAALTAIATSWDDLGPSVSSLVRRLAPSIRAARVDSDREAVLASIPGLVEEWLALPSVTRSLALATMPAAERRVYSAGISTKLKRIIRQEARSTPLSDTDLASNMETALRTAIYSRLRLVLNSSAPSPNNPERTAAWFFVRDLCYASMFRYNDKGEFNIPYGGMAYNSKRLMTRVASCSNPVFLDLLSRTDLNQGDFLDTMSKAAPVDGDFIFLDPPYDSEFNAYEGQSFDASRQRELAEYLEATPASFLLVIKETPFIASLYDNNAAFLVERIERSYRVNVQNRNARAVTHLYISPRR